MGVRFKKGEIYACHHGDHAGKLFAFVKKQDGYNFLMMPDMKNVCIDEKDIELGIKNKILRFVEQSPNEVYTIIEAQYRKNEDTDNRWEQSRTSSLLGC